MPTTHLLGIAPYDELNHSMSLVAQQFDDMILDTYTANLEEGQELATKLANHDYEAIISRGGTANLVQQVVDLPVIDISISVYDILSSIKLAQNYSQNIAIVGYESITRNAHLICEILQYKIKIITIKNAEETQDALERLRNEGCDLILCDAITNQVAARLSINTILITSGLESIQNAYQQALTQIKHIQKVKKQYSLLLHAIQNQSLSVAIFDTEWKPIISNLDNDLTKSLQRLLSRKEQPLSTSKIYHNHNKQTYQVNIHAFQEEERSYYQCEVKKVTPPLVHQQTALSYQSCEEITDYLGKKLQFTSFIQDKNLALIPPLLKHYNAMLIFGEEGTVKISLAYSCFLKFHDNTENLVTINCKLLDDRLWKYLFDSTNSPLLDSGNTILFQHCEQLSLKEIQKLLGFINDTLLLQRQNLIFTYTTLKADPNKLVFQEIMNNLNCASLYSASLAERYPEFPSIITLLLNRVNIECHTQVIGFVPQAMQTLQKFEWVSNFYQLERVLKKLVLNSSSSYITEHQVTDVLAEERKHQNHLQVASQNDFSTALPTIIKEKTLFDYNQDLVKMVLESNNGNQTKTAKQLGISRTTLWRYLKIN